KKKKIKEKRIPAELIKIDHDSSTNNSLTTHHKINNNNKTKIYNNLTQ
ncbi:MAG: hypothetical protein ACI90V_002951, partial [Bacillariaceae sp.]